jgi:VWFA-related protein
MNFAQGSPPAAGQHAPATQPAAPAPEVIFHTATRLVTIEVVARDHDRHPLTDLTKDDFHVFEQIAGKKEKNEQKIAVFRRVTISQPAAPHDDTVRVPPGVFTNLLTTQKDPFPPTVILIDGLNTEPAAQLQVHAHMLKMLASIPQDVPAAVFLLGHNLTMVQNFTTDPKRLKQALQKASGANSNGLAQMDPRDDPEALSAFVENIPSASHILPAIQRFERETYGSEMDLRVSKTLDALRSIARHIAGYPGRKNLLWVSSSFPIAISPDDDFDLDQMKNYAPQMQEVAAALGDANVAVYPIDPAGVQVSSVFSAGFNRRGDMGRAISREDLQRTSQQQSMKFLADQTGGQVCVNNNDLGDCVKRAVDDGSSFYEIGYYPDASAWNGEFHKISIRTSQTAVRLTYRQGYYARREGAGDQKKAKYEELQRAGCTDLLTATSITMGARILSSDSPGTIKYVLVIDPNAVVATPTPQGDYHLALQLGACTFDHAGKPLRFMQIPRDRTLTAAEYVSAHAENGLLDTLTLPQNTGATEVRLVVKDTVTGRIGSLNIPFAQPGGAAASAKTNLVPQ